MRIFHTSIELTDELAADLEKAAAYYGVDVATFFRECLGNGLIQALKVATPANDDATKHQYPDDIDDYIPF